MDRNGLKIGDLIYVTDWEGEVLERRVVRKSGNLVFVCTEGEYKSARDENREPVAVGWPVENVALR